MSAPSRSSFSSRDSFYSLSSASNHPNAQPRTTSLSRTPTTRDAAPATDEPGSCDDPPRAFDTCSGDVELENSHPTGPAHAPTTSSMGVTGAQMPTTQTGSTTLTNPDSEALSREVNRSQRIYSSLVNWWTWELLAGLISVLSLLAICIVIAMYDGRSYHSIRLVLTLNAVIALLTTIMKAGFLTILAEGTSQLKWLAFTEDQRRPLEDFNVYDAASRGGFGCLRLLLRLRKTFWREVVALAAIFYMASIAVDTFTQQLIQTRYVDSDVEADDVVLARSERYDGYYQVGSNQGGPTPDNLAPDMAAALWSGIYGTSTPTQGLFTCPSGNCTYPLTPSLAVCGQCKNLRSKLTYYGNPDTDTEWNLPNGSGLYPEDAMNLTSTADASQTNAFQEAGEIIASFAYINRTGDSKPIAAKDDVPLAWECALWVCVEIYNASVSAGVLTQNVVQTFNRTVSCAGPSSLSDFQVITPPDLIPGASANHTFKVSALALLALQLKVPEAFTGTVSMGTYGPPSGFPDTGFSISDIMQRFFAMTNPVAMVSNMAAAMTYSIRRNPAQDGSGTFCSKRTEIPLVTSTMRPSSTTSFWPSFSEVSYSPASYICSSLISGVPPPCASTTPAAVHKAEVSPVYSSPAYAGTAYRTDPRVHIVWPWIALPAALVLFSNLFLLYAMYKTHQKREATSIGVWKSNQLPLLCHGLDQPSEETLARELGPNPSIGEMDRHARRLQVRLRKDHAENLKLSI